MIATEFATYQKNILNDYADLSSKLASKYNVFSKDIKEYELKLRVSNAIIKYIVDDLVLTNEAGYSINIIDYDVLIKLSECLNRQISKNYKPTFLTDVENYKSIREGGY